MHKVFRYPKFSQTPKFPQRIFLVLREKTFSTENCDTLILCIKFFDHPIFLKHWRLPQEVFWQCETRNFRRNFVIAPPPLLSITFFPYQKISETQGFCCGKLLQFFVVFLETDLLWFMTNKCFWEKFPYVNGVCHALLLHFSFFNRRFTTAFFRRLSSQTVSKELAFDCLSSPICCLISILLGVLAENFGWGKFPQFS